jgi:exodeoxyribonuclease III
MFYLLIIVDLLSSMKVVTWNCNQAFRKKYGNILSYKSDLLIVPECEHPDNFKKAFYSDVVWIGNNNKKGLGVFSFNNLKISLHESYFEEFKYILPLEVTINNEKITNLIAVWAQDNNDPKRRYIGNVWCALNYYKDLFKEQVIIAGDFNWNVIWDRGKSSLYGTLTDVINLLGQYGIYSAYHSIPDVIFGIETNFGYEKEPTLYHLKDKKKPYHVDYIFASENFISNIKACYVGKCENWITISDHMPVFAEFI